MGLKVFQAHRLQSYPCFMPSLSNGHPLHQDVEYWDAGEAYQDISSTKFSRRFEDR
jgi:hypothetical protein